MLNEVCFYSHFGNGDLFNSREIIRWIIKENPDYRYFYAHSKDPKLFFDIPELSYSSLYSFMDGNKAFILGSCHDLYINTWIGRNSKYVLPGIGCTLKKYVEMFNDTIKVLNNSSISLKLLPENSEQFLPTINFSLMDGLSDIKYTVNSLLKNYNFSVLICTGDVWSNQADNFDMGNVSRYLADKFPRVLFLTTTKIESDLNNLIYTEDITKLNSDLIQISYISTYCRIIVGRSSGPYVFTQIKENLNNPEKIFISFTKHVNASQLAPDIPTLSKKIWSSEIRPKDVALIIEQEIEII